MDEIDACLNCTLPLCDEDSPECLFVQIDRNATIAKKREIERYWRRLSPMSFADSGRGKHDRKKVTKGLQRG